MKYYGMIGFITTEETAPSVFEEVVTERPYRGDVIRVSRRLQSDDKRNDDVTISNEIKIVADAFAYENFQNIRYLTWMGSKWKVNTITVDRPRLTLEIGGVYNGISGPQTTS